MSPDDPSPPAGEPVIRLDGVVKTFRDFWHRPRVRAVKGVTLCVGTGEVFGLLGPNGSGKSTTLKMILGLLNPSSGVVRVFGRSPREVRIKARIGYLPEETRLYPYLTAAEILRFYGRLFDLTPDECRRRVDQLLDMTGLTHVRDRRVGEFSKGMARRLGLAQALINDPDLLVLDEPTSGLDPIGCRQVKDLIQALGRRGKTILLSSHLLADVQDVCGRLAILRHGRLAVEGRTRELLEDRGTVSLALDGVSEAAAREVAAAVRERFHLEPRLEHPSRSLERFFLEIVEKAPAVDAPDISGATPASGVAPYLAAPAARGDPDSVLASLVSAPPASQAAASDPVVEPDGQAEADARLKHLLAKPGAPHG
jgi:ABC-2 type transport system ATP-binding protein